MKTQTLQGEFDHVYSDDPAIDREADDWKAQYNAAIETSDPGKLPLTPGAKPVLWRLRHLSRGERSLVLDLLHGAGANQAADAAVRLALVACSGATDKVGKAITLKRDGRVGDFVGLRMEALDVIASAYAEQLVAELWGRVINSFN